MLQTLMNARVQWNDEGRQSTRSLGCICVVNPKILALCTLLAGLQPAGAFERVQEQQQRQDVPARDRSDKSRRHSEAVIVSASRVEQEIVNAPAAVTVIGPDVIESQASSNIVDLIRQAPGVNVIQLSNRDFSLASRSSTEAMAPSQLVLVDGRSVYQDFFGFVAWDAIPVGLGDLERVEVVNGPASAVWGANAMNGVVNLITRSPRDATGTTLDIGFGAFDRNVGSQRSDPGNRFSLSMTHSKALNDQLAYRFSAGFTHQGALARPVGEIPNGTGTVYPLFEGLESQQPRLDFRLDRDASDGRNSIRVSGGYAGSQGTLHSGLGPLELQRGSHMAYGRLQYERGGLQIDAVLNSTYAEFRSVLVQSSSAEPLHSDVRSNTYDISLKDARSWGRRQILSYGANVRLITMSSRLAPLYVGRNEQGIWAHDEIFLGQKFRLIVGTRADRISVLSRFVLSPRATVVFKPTASHALRVSYNRAFRAPSLANNFLSVQVSREVELEFGPLLRGAFPGLGIPDAALPPPVRYRLASSAVGSLELLPERLTAYEVGWSGALADWIGATVSLYLSSTEGRIEFTNHSFWSGANPPPGWNEAFSGVGQFVGRLESLLPPGTLPSSIAAIQRDPAVLIDLLRAGAGVRLPSIFTYVNRERVQNSGVELGLNARRGGFGGYVNYSLQRTPKTQGYSEHDAAEVAIPPAHRFNAGFDGELGRLRVGASLNYSDGGYFTDVLTSEYHGWTAPYTMVNATVGVSFLEGRFRPSLRAVNLLNHEIQQHIFGDVLKRQVVLQLHYRF